MANVLGWNVSRALDGTEQNIAGIVLNVSELDGVEDSAFRLATT